MPTYLSFTRPRVLARAMSTCLREASVVVEVPLRVGPPDAPPWPRMPTPPGVNRGEPRQDRWAASLDYGKSAQGRLLVASRVDLFKGSPCLLLKYPCASAHPMLRLDRGRGFSRTRGDCGARGLGLLDIYCIRGSDGERGDSRDNVLACIQWEGAPNHGKEEDGGGGVRQNRNLVVGNFVRRGLDRREEDHARLRGARLPSSPLSRNTTGVTPVGMSDADSLVLLV